jgi:hypothetical protein
VIPEGLLTFEDVTPWTPVDTPWNFSAKGDSNDEIHCSGRDSRP